MAMISVDNGNTFMDIVEFVHSGYSYAWLTRSWGIIASAMDDDVREAVHSRFDCIDADETDNLKIAEANFEFLKQYLDIADTDLIVG